VAEDVGAEIEQYFMERAADYPGVIVERRTVREYPYGPLAAHVLGYVGEINDEELLARGGEIPGGDAEPATTTTVPGQASKPYEAGDSIGKTGVEQAYEMDLRAVPGERTIEVNAKGEMLDVVSDTAPVPGDDLWLTIDIDVQALAETKLTEKITGLQGGSTKDGRSTDASQGSVVITDPGTGEVRAMASYPTYDPRMLVNGIPTALWDDLQNPATGLPLNNWAIQGGYAPGSTFKPVTALAGMRSGFIRPGNETYYDQGVYRLQNCKSGKCEFQNAGRARLGSVNLVRSLTASSDVYYYWIGENLWLGRGAYGETPIQDTAGAFGLGERTGIELPGEIRGRMPTPQNRREAYEANPDAFMTGDWFTGDNLNTAIGQGDVLVTPLQLANTYATLANGGAVMKPHVAFRTTRALDPTEAPGAEGNYEVVRTIEPAEVGRVEMTPDQYGKIFEGLVGVTQDSTGTSYSVWRANPTAWPFAGKTGTAQVKGKADTSVFAGWGPAVPGQPPEYAIAVVIPEAGFGSDVAAPLTFDILAPMSRGQVDPVCPALDPERTECEESKAAAYARLEAALTPDEPSGGTP
jgi:penicillin-binding protein 2